MAAKRFQEKGGHLARDVVEAVEAGVGQRQDVDAFHLPAEEGGARRPRLAQPPRPLHVNLRVPAGQVGVQLVHLSASFAIKKTMTKDFPSFRSPIALQRISKNP